MKKVLFEIGFRRIFDFKFEIKRIFPDFFEISAYFYEKSDDFFDVFLKFRKITVFLKCKQLFI